MLDNVHPIEELSGLARARARNYETRTVNPALVDQMIAEEWSVDKSNKKSVRLRRQKAHGTLLEDRVWTLLYRMQFPLLSGQGGSQLTLNPKDEKSAESQIDVVAIDNEVAIAVECKSCEKASRRPQFQHELGKHTLIRERFRNSLRSQFPASHSRPTVLAMFMSNILLSDNDLSRAREANVLAVRGKNAVFHAALSSCPGVMRSLKRPAEVAVRRP